MEEKLETFKNFINPNNFLPNVGILNENEFKKTNERYLETKNIMTISSNLNSNSNPAQNLIQNKDESAKIEDLKSNTENKSNIIGRNCSTKLNNSENIIENQFTPQATLSNPNQLQIEIEKDSENKIKEKVTTVNSSTNQNEKDQKIIQEKENIQNCKNKLASNKEISIPFSTVLSSTIENQDALRNKNLEDDLSQKSSPQIKRLSIYFEDMNPFVETNSIISNGLNCDELKVKILE